MHVAGFSFNPFSENTYILYDDTKQCVIVDPGCFDQNERDILTQFIISNALNPVILFNTHCHIDHILGNKYISEKFGLKLTAHKGESQELGLAQLSSEMYGIPYEASPEIEIFVDEGDVIKFGNTELDILYTPGHSSNSLCLVHHETKQIIAGDVLFQGSIGRTDLPGGDFATLMSSIKNKILVLDDAYQVYSGHGDRTNIGTERRLNPFLQDIS